MTLNEITKRFEFDLKMGRFGYVTNPNTGDIYYPFYEIESDDLELLYKFLIKLGYKDSDKNDPFLHFSYKDKKFKGISVSSKFKIFFGFRVDDGKGKCKLNYKVPDYIKEFVKNDNWGNS